MEINNYRVEVIGGKHIDLGTIDKGEGCRNSYVELKDGDHYKLRMRNSHNERCHATVTIDGKDMGTWVLGKYETICIERPSNVDKKFTFFLVSSKGGQAAGLRANDPSNGLVQVEFTPEKPYVHRYTASGNDSGIDEVKRIMIQNIDRMLEDNERIEELSCRTSDLSCQSKQLRSDPVTPTKGIACWNRDGDRDSSNFFERWTNGSRSNDRASSTHRSGGTGLQGKSDQKFSIVAPLDLDRSRRVTISLRLVGKHEPDYERITPLTNLPFSNPVPAPIYDF